MAEKRLIDADKLTRWLEAVLANANPLDRKARAAFSEALAMVKTMPTIDAVEVVRCRECAGRKKNKFCIEWLKYVPDDGFCHLGAKMEENKKED